MRWIGLTVLMAFLLLAGPKAFAACQQKKQYTSKIVINMETPDPVYDLSNDIKFLNNDGGASAKEWIEKNKMQGIWSSQHMEKAGQAAGGWAVYYNYKLDVQPFDPYWAYACLYIKDMTISMMYRTIIMIPKDYKKGGCAYNLIQDHELKHFNVGKSVAQKTAERLRQDMPKILERLEAEHVGSDKAQQRADQMKVSMTELVDVYFKHVMREEMGRLNNQVDSPEEYAGIGRGIRACGKQ